MTDTTDNLYNAIMDIKGTLGSVKTTIDRHDVVITQISHAVTRMESKQNEDMARFIAEKETIYDRLKPLEADLKKRSEFGDEVKKKSWEVMWDWGKLGIIFLAGYLLTAIRKI